MKNRGKDKTHKILKVWRNKKERRERVRIEESKD